MSARIREGDTATARVSVQANTRSRVLRREAPAEAKTFRIIDAKLQGYLS